MWTVNFSQIFVNGGQPRAEKRVIKFAGCQVNDVKKLENLQLTWGLKKILAGRGSPGGAGLSREGCPAEASRGPSRRGKWNRMARRRRAAPPCVTNAGANGKREPRKPMKSIAICGRSCASIAKGCGEFTGCRIMSWVAVSSRPGLCLLRS